MIIFERPCAKCKRSRPSGAVVQLMLRWESLRDWMSPRALAWYRSCSHRTSNLEVFRNASSAFDWSDIIKCVRIGSNETLFVFWFSLNVSTEPLLRDAETYLYRVWLIMISNLNKVRSPSYPITSLQLFLKHSSTSLCKHWPTLKSFR